MLQVFSANEEVELEKYLQRASDIYFGLSPNEVRKLAYEYAVFMKKGIPVQWSERLIAGKDHSYFDGYPCQRSIRKREGKSQDKSFK